MEPKTLELHWRSLLAKRRPRDAVLLNAAAAIAAYEARFDLNLHDRIAIGLEKAIASVDSGAAAQLVQKWAALSQKLAVL